GVQTCALPILPILLIQDQHLIWKPYCVDHVIFFLVPYGYLEWNTPSTADQIKYACRTSRRLPKVIPVWSAFGGKAGVLGWKMDIHSTILSYQPYNYV